MHIRRMSVFLICILYPCCSQGAHMEGGVSATSTAVPTQKHMEAGPERRVEHQSCVPRRLVTRVLIWPSLTSPAVPDPFVLLSPTCCHFSRQVQMHQSCLDIGQQSGRARAQRPPACCPETASHCSTNFSHPGSATSVTPAPLAWGAWTLPRGCWRQKMMAGVSLPPSCPFDNITWQAV